MAITVGGDGPDRRANRQRSEPPQPRRAVRPTAQAGTATRGVAQLPPPDQGPDPDRKNTLRQSRRHTVIVRGLRVVFPILAVATVGLYMMALKRNWTFSVPGGGQIDFSSVGFTGQNLVVNNPRYRGFNKDGSTFLVTAKTGIQDIRRQDLVQLQDISGNLLQLNHNEFRLTSKQGLFDSKKNELELWDHIYIESDNGMKGWLSRAMVYMKESIIVSKEPVVLEALNGTIKAEQMTVNQKTHKAAFEGNVRVHLLRSKPATGADPKKVGKVVPASAVPIAPGATEKSKPAAPPTVMLRPGQSQ